MQADGSTYAHEYVIKDHLGNTRVTYRDDNTTASPLGTIKVEEIVQTNHYYPFGLNMEGTWNGSFPEAKNKYQYNGKELNTDLGLDWNDYGARFYDPSVSRWLGVDPLSEKMRRHSPYNYAFDNPIRFVDPDGMQGEDWVKGKNGKIYNDFEVTSKFEAWQKGVEYIGNNKLLVDKNTNAGYFLPFCSATAECWGQIGNPVTVTESSNAPAIRFGNPDYEPYNHIAVGFQFSGSIDVLRTSYSVSFGLAVGQGEMAGFMTTGIGFNYAPTLLSGSASATIFGADKVEHTGAVSTSLTNLAGDSVGSSMTAGVFTAGMSNTKANGSLKPTTTGYNVKNIGFSTPGFNFKAIEYTRTKLFPIKMNP